MRERILTFINILLVLAAAGCIYYLVTAEYREPLEIRQAWNNLHERETGYSPTGATETGQDADHPATAIYANLDKDFMAPLYTPTPTPSPTPTPPPPAPILADVVADWRIQELNADSVVIVARDNESFELKVGDVKQRPDPRMQDRMVPVRLDAIDLDAMQIVVGFEDQKKNIAFQ